jgi:hypothetical protein
MFKSYSSWLYLLDGQDGTNFRIFGEKKKVGKLMRCWLLSMVIGKKVNNCYKWVNNKHSNYPPCFCFTSDIFINCRVNKHP